MRLPIVSPMVLFVVALTILVADYFWLGSIARGMYDHLRMALNPGISKKDLPYRIIPAILAYSVMVISLSTLAVPNVTTNSGIVSRLLTSFAWGGMWGLGVYGTYDMTNLAVIKSYPVVTAIIDLLWGVVLGAIGAFTGSFVV